MALGVIVYTANTKVVTGDLNAVQTMIQSLITSGENILHVIKGKNGEWLIVHKTI